MHGDVNLAEVVAHLSQVLPDDAIIANGSGNNTVWLHRFFQYKAFGTQVAATSGSMGYGVPAAVAAGLVHPDRTVICVNGDGCFLMLGQELATAVQYGSAPIIIVVNNSMLATIRMHQERRFSGRVIATELVNPDFPGLARAYGAHGERVRRTDEFPAAFERARGSGRPAVIEIIVDPESLNPRETITDLRQAARSA
jgi:acetolactate synthase-1/2/3 large subunit